MTLKRFNALPGAPRVLPPPAPDDNAKRALNRYGAARGEDGRISRSTGRDVQFATIVTPEFKDWIKAEAKRRGKRMCVAGGAIAASKDRGRSSRSSQSAASSDSASARS